MLIHIKDALSFVPAEILKIFPLYEEHLLTILNTYSQDLGGSSHQFKF
jgi:hypothetical protein